MTDLLATSPDTWRDRDRDPAAVPPELIPPRDAGPRERNAAFWRRHDVRRQRAEDVYAASRNPERGWPVSGNRAVLAFFRDLLASRRRMFAALVVLNALAAATGLVVPRLLGELVNTTVDGGGGLALDSLAIVIVGVVLAQAGFTFVAQRTSTYFGQDLLSTAREYIVRTILRLPLGAVEGASTGDLVTRVTRDVGTMSRSVQYGLPMAIISLLTVVLSVGAMLLNSVVLAVPALLTFATSAWAVRGYLRRAPKAYITEGATYSRINTTLTETVEGARTLEALGLSGVRVGVGNDDIEVSAQAERYTMSLRNILFIALNFAFGTPRVVTLLVGAYAYNRGWVDLGQITAAVLYVEALSDPHDRLISEVDRLQVGAASTSRLLGIAEVKPDRTPGDRMPEGVELVGEDLRFAYRPGRDVLHGVDLRLGQGERLALVGPSGSGKTTVAATVLGLVPPRAGTVAVAGGVGYLAQDAHLFDTTVAENLRIGRRDADDRACAEVLARVGLDLPLDRLVGEHGSRLSGGEAQRVALARLLLREDAVVILDEPTEHLDAPTAEALVEDLLAATAGAAVLVITHDPVLVARCDRVVSLAPARVPV